MDILGVHKTPPSKIKRSKHAVGYSESEKNVVGTFWGSVHLHEKGKTSHKQKYLHPSVDAIFVCYISCGIGNARCHLVVGWYGVVRCVSCRRLIHQVAL